jgi:hypothetical protein
MLGSIAILNLKRVLHTNLITNVDRRSNATPIKLALKRRLLDLHRRTYFCPNWNNAAYKLTGSHNGQSIGIEHSHL